MSIHQAEILDRWKRGNFLEVGVAIPGFKYDLPWVPYENYMQVQLVEAIPGQPGKLIIQFPKDGAEDEQFHIHPVSDRVITVLQGSGQFVAIRNFTKVVYELEAGCRLCMPRGVVRNFFGNLLVESLHLPFIAFESPFCFVRVLVD